MHSDIVWLSLQLACGILGIANVDTDFSLFVVEPKFYHTTDSQSCELYNNSTRFRKPVNEIKTSFTSGDKRLGDCGLLVNYAYALDYFILLEILWSVDQRQSASDVYLLLLFEWICFLRSQAIYLRQECHKSP